MSRPPGDGPSGLLLVDKPCGPTSHDVVSLARRIAGTRKIGHAGTLDPPASGLLPLAFGRATRLIRYLPASPKVYVGSFQLGVTTQTDDLDGETLETYSGPLPDVEATVDAARGFLGSSLQVPPKVSARKIGGRRMYDLARKGIEVEAQATPIELGRFEVEGTDQAGRYRFEAEVSGGTYIRGIVRDLGARLGCGAALAELRRTSIGPLQVENAVSLDPADPDARESLLRALIPLRDCPLAVPQVRLDQPGDAESFMHGRRVELASAPEVGPFAVLDGSGELLGLAESEAGFVRPKVVLAPPTRPS